MTIMFIAEQRRRGIPWRIHAEPYRPIAQPVTAEDGKLGDQHLRAFQDNEKTIPTILTTSEKLATGMNPSCAHSGVIPQLAQSCSKGSPRRALAGSNCPRCSA